MIAIDDADAEIAARRARRGDEIEARRARKRRVAPTKMAPMNILLSAALSINPFTSNVAHLTPGNWSLLEKSPHIWMVNVCRQS